MRKVTIIPKNRNLFSATPETPVTKRRVAGYARVSTDSDEQFTSYEAQIDYYTRFITARQDWTFVNVYTDEGISGTNTKKREGFNQMIADALAGKIDLIVTKSVSRFARNTVDSLTSIRKLKEHGVEVFFEKEGIWTFDGKGELLITIMSSLAQEESRSISENVTWGCRKRFADGKFSFGYSHFLGYDKGPDGTPVINQEQAKVVVQIFRMFIEGKAASKIAQELTRAGIPTPSGKTKWSYSTVMSILQNEKYKGDALLQKGFTVDFLTKKFKKNEGEVPQYYVEASHEPIIAPEEFDLVQAELKRRRQAPYRSANVLCSRLVCAACGSFYGPKVWHSNDKYRHIVWRCNAKFKGDKKCPSPVLREEQIKGMFMVAYDALTSSRTQIAADTRAMVAKLTDCTQIDGQITEAEQVLDEVSVLIRAAIHDHAQQAGDQTAFNKRYGELEARYTAAQERLAELNKQKEERLDRKRRISRFLDDLKRAEPLDRWDDRLWQMLVEKAVVQENGSINFVFFNGKVIHVEPKEWRH